jgi:protein SPT2
MPIGDLLAEISGERPLSAPADGKAPKSAGTKRKADGDSSEITNPKVAKARREEGPYSTSSISSTTRKPSPPDSRRDVVTKPSTTTITSAPHSNGRPYSGTATSVRASKPKPSPLPRPTAKKDAAPSKMTLPKSSPVTLSPSELGNKAPKKGSFAEIMARGAKAQQIMPRPGAIQHKAIERPVSKRERMEHKAGAKGSLAKKPSANGHTDRSAAGAPRDTAKHATSRESKPVGRSRPSSSGSDRAAPDRKFKKAATATTGYTGTARPPPSSAKKASGSRHGGDSTSRGGALLAPPKASRSRYLEDEYDSELDDFIDNDEEDEADGRGGRRYDYASDGSSDMEAGLSDIDEEESRAARIARQEDRREEAELERRRIEKEDRKRRLL